MISRITRIGFFALAFLVIAGISAYITLTLFIKQENTVIVPDLVGKDVVDVLFLLTDLGLNTKVGGAEYNRDMPANHILFQEPKPGDEIKRDRDVRITISKGPKTVQVPNLKGVSISQARILLEENGLCLGTQSSVFSGTVRKDDIVAHSPAAGRTLSRGSCVDILVSGGARPVAYKMPDLSGRALEETILMFESVDLRLGTVRPVSYTNRPWNSIVEQEPLPGHRVMEGFRVDLAVNRAGGEANRETSIGFAGTRLFRYRAADGFLKRRIQVRLNGFGGSIELYDDFLTPGDEIWYIIPDNPDTTLLVYEDGALVPASRDEWEAAFGFNPTGFDVEIPELDTDKG